jgi:hypothetical protein
VISTDGPATTFSQPSQQQTARRSSCPEPIDPPAESRTNRMTSRPRTRAPSRCEPTPAVPPGPRSHLTARTRSASRWPGPGFFAVPKAPGTPRKTAASRREAGSRGRTEPMTARSHSQPGPFGGHAHRPTAASGERESSEHINLTGNCARASTARACPVLPRWPGSVSTGTP